MLGHIYKLHKSGCRSDLLKQDSYLADLREQDVDLQIEGGTNYSYVGLIKYHDYINIMIIQLWLISI